MLILQDLAIMQANVLTKAELLILVSQLVYVGCSYVFKVNTENGDQKI